MKIGIDIKALARGKAGIARYLREILRNLAAIDTANQYCLFEKDPVEDVPKAPNFRRLSLPSRLPGTLWLQTVVPRQMIKHGIDIFWCPEHIAPLARALETPTVITVHDLTFKHYPRSLQRSNYWIFKLLFARSLKKAKSIIAVSEFTRRDLIRCYKSLSLEDKVIAIYNGRPGWKLPQSYNPENRGEHLLFVGSPEPRKNLIAVLRALAILKEKGRKIALRIVGPAGWKNRNLSAFIKKHNLTSQITFAGYCEYDRLFEEYIACKALIYPSFLEGFGLPVLEALETDTLVLASRETVMEEIGGKAVMTIDPHNARDIASALERLYQDSFNRYEYLAHSVEALAKFSWKESARRHLEVFRKAGGLRPEGNMEN
jgi:glycosyltransferase involved in cell wall biosynthesis